MECRKGTFKDVLKEIQDCVVQMWFVFTYWGIQVILIAYGLIRLLKKGFPTNWTISDVLVGISILIVPPVCFVGIRWSELWINFIYSEIGEIM